jgi:hypothetical protein
MLAIVSGDDPGSKVILALQVIEEARDHMLMLSRNGKFLWHQEGPGPTRRPVVHAAPDRRGVKAVSETAPSLTSCDIMPATTATTWHKKSWPKVIRMDGALIHDRSSFEAKFLTCRLASCGTLFFLAPPRPR